MKIVTCIIFCILLTITFFVGLNEATKTTSTTNNVSTKQKLIRINRLVSNFQKKSTAPGMAIAVVVNGRIAFTQPYGLRTYADRKSPVTERTLFPIGSCTKAFTALLLAQLVRQGHLAYNDPVTSRISEFRMSNLDITYRIQVKDLLTHGSGLPGYDFVWYHSNMPRNELLNRIPYLRTTYDLREEWQYSSIMYAVAGIVVERTTNRSWEDAVRDRVFKPLNMKRSYSSLAEAQRNSGDDIATPHTVASNGTRILTVPNLNVTVVGPGGSIFSTIGDMAKWVSFQLSKNVPKEMHTVQIARPPDEGEEIALGYGLGWYVSLYRGRYLLYHLGRVDGSIAGVALFPQQNFGVVVFANLDTVILVLLQMIQRISDILEDHSLPESDEEWVSKYGEIASQPLLREYNSSSAGPVHRPGQYVGHYENLGFGVVHVFTAQNRLYALFNNIYYAFSPDKGPDFFTIFPLGLIISNPFECSFARNSSGDIVGCRVNWESTVDPIFFKKK